LPIGGSTPKPTNKIISHVINTNPSSPGEVKGEETEDTVEVKGARSSFSWTFFVLSGLGIMVAVCGLLLYREWKKQKELEI
jgi:hypothetical protein